jgi:hypothetical protein
VKPKDAKRVLGEEILENRDEVVLTDLLYTANRFPLGDLVQGVDVVHPSYAIEISLMNRVHTYVAGPSLWIRATPLPILAGGWLGLLDG